MEYSCNKCDRVFNTKSNYTRHITSSTTCKRVVNNDFTCIYCFKKYNRKDNLTRHKLKCKSKPQQTTEKENLIKPNNDNLKTEDKEEIKKEFKNVTEELEQMKLSMNENTIIIENMRKQLEENNKKTTKLATIYDTIIIDPIKIIPYCNLESINNYISDDKYNTFFEMGINSIYEIIKFIHFDIDKPIFHNCMVTNQRSSTGLTYDGESWISKNQKDIACQLCIKYYRFLKEKYLIFKEEKKLTKKAKLEHLTFKIIDNSEKSLTNIDHSISNIKGMLYNSRNIIIKTKNKQEKQQKYCESIKNGALLEQKNQELKRVLEEVEELKKIIEYQNINNNTTKNISNFTNNDNSITNNDNSINNIQQITNNDNSINDNSTTNNTQIINNDNSINNNVILNNTINVIPFGKENEKFDDLINDTQTNHILLRGVGSIIELLRYAHFEENENLFNNCLINETSETNGFIYDGQDWIAQDKNEIVKSLIKNYDDYLDNRYKVLEEKNKLKPVSKKRYDIYKKKKEDKYESKIIFKDQDQGVKNMLYTKSDIINETKIEMEKQKKLTQ